MASMKYRLSPVLSSVMTHSVIWVSEESGRASGEGMRARTGSLRLSGSRQSEK